MKKTESAIFNRGIEILRECFGGTDVLILSELYRLEPDEYHLAGKLGADVYIEGKKIFIGHQEMEDILFYGKAIAEDMIGTILLT